MRQPFNDSPLWGLASTLTAILLDAITVSGALATIFYAAIGVFTGWILNAIKNKIKQKKHLKNEKS
jgi:hypothetical protein